MDTFSRSSSISSRNMVSSAIPSFRFFRISSSHCSFFYVSLSSSFSNSNFIGVYTDAYFTGFDCELLLRVCPRSIPRYKYLSASGVSILANAARSGLTCTSNIDGMSTGTWLPACLLCLKLSKVTGRLPIEFRDGAAGHLSIGFHGKVTGHLLFITGCLYCCFPGLIFEAVL